MRNKTIGQLIFGISFSCFMSEVSIAQTPFLLDDTCVVTIGNQTVFVKSDGTFLARNISVFRSRATGIAPQLYRVRATCLRNDEMITGLSEFFPLTPGSTSFISDVFPSALEPLPLNINVTSSAEFLPLNGTAQLSVTATLPDGSTKNVTTRATGTTYLSTNPNLLTVSEDGLVTGANSSTSPRSGMIAVLNEGNISTIFINAVGQSNDFDNDGMPNDYEDLFGLNKFANNANGDIDNDGLTNIKEFNLGTLPNNPDTDADGIPDGSDANPLTPDEEPPIVTITLPENGDTLTEGETIKLKVEATDDGLVSQVSGFVNDVNIGTILTPPYEFLFTVPYSTDTLSFEANAMDSSGNNATTSKTISVITDALTTVEGSVVDIDLVPVANADIAIKLSGLKGEFFDFNNQLTTFPDLAGRTPDVTKLISAINFINPNNTLSLDTFGVDLSPDFSARFTGQIQLPASGAFTFKVGADDGARLTIDGTQVVEVIGTGEFTEDEGTIHLSAGTKLIVIEYFQGVDDAELQLTVTTPSGETSIVSPSDLIQNSDMFATQTSIDGQFTFADVPTILGNIIAETELLLPGGTPQTGSSDSIPPVAGDITDVGVIQVSATPEQILVFGNRSERITLVNDLTSLGFSVTLTDSLPIDLSPYGIIWHVDIFSALTADERNRLSKFVALRRGLHLTGERRCCETLNDSIELLLNQIIVNTGVQVGGLGDISGSYPFNSNATGNIDDTPNQLTFWSPDSPGGMGGLGEISNPNILVTGGNGVPVGGVWNCGDLVSGKGRVTLLMDINWFTDSGRIPVIENIQNFLATANHCRP